MAKSAGKPQAVHRLLHAPRWMCSAWLVLAIGLAVGVGEPAAGAEESPCPAPEGAVMAPVAFGADGLITAAGVEVVLAGIAPLPSGATFPEIWRGPRGPGADVPQPLHLVQTAPPDRYGRLAGLVFDARGALLQAALIEEGHAIVRPDTVDEACAERLLALESAARSAGNGLWRHAGNVAKAVDASSLLARSGLYVLVEGRIVSVGYGSRMVFLDFGRSFRTDFTVLVQGTLVSRLREAGFPVESLEGRTVRVRGIIEESGGPAIRLASPLALELVDVME